MYTLQLLIAPARLLAGIFFIGLLLAAASASAQVSCGDTIGPGQWAFMTGNLNCTAANTDGECALYVRGPDAFLHGLGHRLRCTTATVSGVCVLGTGARVESLTVRGCEDGFQVEGGGGHHLEDVHARSNAREGFIVRSNDNTIVDSSSKNNSVNGVVNSARRNWYDRVTSNGNSVNGFEFRDSSGGDENDITGAVAKRNNVHGLLINDGADDNDVRGSVFQNNGVHGVRVRGDRNRFTKVDFVGNGVHGLDIRPEGEENEVTQSDASGNDVHGVSVDGDRNHVLQNDIMNNGVFGVALEGTSEDNVVVGNDISGNGDADIDDLGTGNVVGPNP